MTKNFSAAAKTAGLALLIAVGASQAVQAAPPGTPVPQPKILVINRAAILQASQVGQDIIRQAQALQQQAERELKGQDQALQGEFAAMQRQAAILSASAKAQKQREFDAKRVAFQKKIQERSGLIQGGLYKARAQMDQALGPILQGIMKERGANILVDRNAIVFSTVDIDITGIAVQRLNQKLPTVKVTLAPLPPGMQQPPQQ